MKSYLKQAAMAATDAERNAILLEGANFFSVSLSKTIRCNRMDAPLMYAVLKRYEEAVREQTDPVEAAFAESLKNAMESVTIFF